jgi:hypothetical protein
MQIKDTDTAVENSKHNKFSQNKLVLDPQPKLKKQVDPFKKNDELELMDQEAEQESLIARMNALVEEKSQELMNLTMQNQKANTQLSLQ